MTVSITVSCPTRGCSNSHTVVVSEQGHDRAETICKDCKNRIVVKAQNGDVVGTEVA